MQIIKISFLIKSIKAFVLIFIIFFDFVYANNLDNLCTQAEHVYDSLLIKGTVIKEESVEAEKVILDRKVENYFIELYKNYIPNSVLQSKSASWQTNQILENLSKIDLDLIYLYLKFVNLKYKKHTHEPDSIVKIDLKQSIEYSKFLRNEWATNEIEKLDNTIDDGIRKETYSAYFKNYLYKFKNVDFPAATKMNISNEQHFIIYKFITSEKNTKYNNNISYEKLVAAELEQLISKFSEIYKDSNKLRYSAKKEIIDLAFQFSFLFKGRKKNNYSIQTDFHLYEFILSIFPDNLKNKNSISLYLVRRTVPINIDKDISIYNHIIDKTYIAENVIQSSASNVFGIGFRMKLQDEIDEFSFINFRFGYSYNTLNFLAYAPYEFSASQLYEFDVSWKNYTDRQQYEISNFRNLKSSSISAMISTPLFHFNKGIWLESGSIFLYNRASFNYSYYENIRQINVYGTNIISEESKNVKFKQNKNILFFTFGLKYEIIENLVFHFEYIIPSEFEKDIQNYQVGFVYSILNW